ncbi:MULTISPECIES: hypothetical protein [unclassified Thiomonas]|uniref:hypothetical protein n=1 Tax=unclassified Thiomonas TaxID=2625466 RepID=UPI0004DBC816|nr:MULTISPECIES: hypothetical protein [unclassified Thiomonas]CDW96126.1 hypothetical protein THICB2_730205 [Thiomonas sp. CB2]VDY06910.1 protein of unknown function [Thiomonas sp. Bio17B3]VDY07870.1 protein of unknown function [Thiomonas sp. Sup16B3]VDY09794.1 protein of unknown function [Thiomonas sp. Sup16B3]VDY10535.1 protein of unknown function [Thiomonas sp. Sup16B3]
MAYSNSEQIFIDVLGRSPTEPEWKEIHALLGAATRTGCVVDDESNAVQVVWLAWGWVRGIGRADVLALLRGSLLDVDTALDDVRKDMDEAIKSLQDSLNAIVERTSTQPATASAPQINPEELVAALGPFLHAPAQVTQHYHVGDSVKDALHKAFKWTWVAGAIGIGLFVSVFWTRMYIQDTRQIADLAAANAAQTQQLKDLRAQPTGAARRAEHKRP